MPVNMQLVQDPLGSTTLTLSHLDALHGLIVDRAGALLEELVSLDAQVKHLCAIDRQLDDLLHHNIDDVRRSLVFVVHELSTRSVPMNMALFWRATRKHLVFCYVRFRGRARLLLSHVGLGGLGLDGLSLGRISHRRYSGRM
jgi:hypothetical protein